jgi:hypothetical protein
VLALAVLTCLQTLAEQPDEGTGTVRPQTHLVSTIGSERATQGNGNMVVTWSNKTHVVWQDSSGVKAYKNMVRTLDRSTGVWSRSHTLNAAKDNHARPVIAVDSRGYLHVVLGGHHSPVKHLTSARPNDSSEWDASEEIGMGTYPMLVVGPDDALVTESMTCTRLVQPMVSANCPILRILRLFAAIICRIQAHSGSQ